MDKVVVIGDSHTSLFDNNSERNRGVWSDSLVDIFDCRWIGPVTYWRLCRDQRKFIDFDYDIRYNPMAGIQISTKIKPGQDVIINLGEIDVRCNILKQGFDNYKTVVDNMCDKIKTFITSYENKYKIHLMSISPTIYRTNFPPRTPLFPFVGTDDERKNVTLYFNDKLRYISNELDIGYFDIYDIYCDDNGMMDINKSDKIVHGMKNLDLEKYIKEYFKL